MLPWNEHTEKALNRITNRLRRRRVDLFVSALNLGPDDSVLDLGSEEGSYLAAYYPYPQNIVLADIREEPMRRGVARFGLKGYLLLDTNGPIPLDANAFDAVWCNSVIEHVTVGRDELPTISQDEFYARSEVHQRTFASEIARVGRQFFVQTPYLHFPVEAHSWLPWVQYLPRRAQWTLARGLRRLWVKRWKPDFYLYDMRRFREHFPNATAFHKERVFGVPKSLIALRTNQRTAPHTCEGGPL